MSWTEERLKEILKWQNNNKFENFIDEDKLHTIIEKTKNPTSKQVNDVLSLAKDNAKTGKMLSLEDTAILLNSKDMLNEICTVSKFIKKEVYGNRIVLFSPLYVSSPCVNSCKYCGFSSKNTSLHKKILKEDELDAEIEALLDMGQKRLIAVFGEHPKSDANFIAKCTKQIYAYKKNGANIRRININAAPMFEDEYKIIKNEGIGTYQIFQETYHKHTYEMFHPKGTLKGEYDWRVFGLHRAMNAGIDDVGIGVLFGLYDYRFEVLSLLSHAYSLEKYFGVGPHTISFPRIKRTSNTNTKIFPNAINDEDFIKIVAIIRIMCPFTGTILTAREDSDLRDIMIEKCGISQADCGTNIGIGGYSTRNTINHLENQQFEIGDQRSIDEFILALIRSGKIPSFCTSCYREGRTGCNFMPLAKSAKIKHLCIPNALLTFKEYLRDYASVDVKSIADSEIIPKYLLLLEENLPNVAKKVDNLLKEVDDGRSDCHL